MKILYWLFVFTFLSVSYCFSQDSATTVFHINKIPAKGILLNKGWKFQPGDNPEWAKPDYNDRVWQSINPTLVFTILSQKYQNQESVGFAYIFR